MTRIEDLRKREIHLVLARSPEDRCCEAITRLQEHGASFKCVSVLHFGEYDDESSRGMERVSHTQYWKHAERIQTIAGAANVVVPTVFTDVSACRDIAAVCNADLVVDISCIPRMHLTAIVSSIPCGTPAVLAYSDVGDYQRSEKSFSVGVSGFGSIPGLTGSIRHGDNVAVIIGGFEGSRAYSAYNKVAPVSAHLLLGDAESDELFEVALRNNHQLVANHRVKHSRCHSYEPYLFGKQLFEVMSQVARLGDKNVCLIPMGTKVQTAVAAALASQFPKVQYFFPHPTYRRLSSVGVGNVSLFDLDGIRQVVPVAA